MRKPGGKSRGFGFVGYGDIETAEKAKKFFDGSFIDTSKISCDRAKSIGDPRLDECWGRRKKIRVGKSGTVDKEQRHDPLEDDPEYLEFVANSRGRSALPSWNQGPAQPDKLEKEPEIPSKPRKITHRLYVTNVPYDSTAEDLESFFSQFGEVADVVIPIDNIAQRPKGFVFITFSSSESVEAALKESVIFQGHHLRLERAEPQPEEEKPHLPNDDESFKQKKQRLLRIEKPQSWNALFLNKDTVIEATAARLGFTKAQLLNPDSPDLATRVTLAESQLIKETKEMFEKAGIDLDLFSNLSSTSKLSKTVIIAKNLKFRVTETEIHDLFSAYGSLVRFIFPPTHSSAVIEFAKVEDARKAFRALNFRKVLDQPMLLQWAPAGAEGFQEEEPGSVSVKPKKSAPISVKSTTLIMKNVPFKATKKELYDIVNTYARVKAIRMPKKADASGHRGFAFLDFNTKQEAAAALENLGNVHLYDRHLVVQETEHGRNVESLSARSGD